MVFSEILLEKNEQYITTITMNRPQFLNALTLTMLEELHQAFQKCQEDKEVRALIITGAGRGFCAGADLKKSLGEATEVRDQWEMVRSFDRLILRMRDLDKPVISAVNGVAVGGGACMAIASDMVIAAKGAQFGFVFPRVGLSGADLGATYFLPRLIGLVKANELLFTGETITAEEAAQMGMINRVVPPEELLPNALVLARKIAGNSPIGMAITKMAINKGLALDVSTDLEFEAYLQSLCMQSEDFQEGLRSFQEKRPPLYSGR